MADAKVSLYEGLFLLNPATTSSDFAGAVEHVRNFFTRANAELVVLRKWEERRLAYEIEGQKRGTYLLAYFRAPGSAISHIERDVNLSEKVMRVMMLKADHIGDVELELAARDADLSLESKLRSGTTGEAEAAPAREAQPEQTSEAEQPAEASEAASQG